MFLREKLCCYWHRHGAKRRLEKENTACDNQSLERLVSSWLLCGTLARSLLATHSLVRWVHGGKRGIRCALSVRVSVKRTLKALWGFGGTSDVCRGGRSEMLRWTFPGLRRALSPVCLKQRIQVGTSRREESKRRGQMPRSSLRPPPLFCARRVSL